MLNLWEKYFKFIAVNGFFHYVLDERFRIYKYISLNIWVYLNYKSNMGFVYIFLDKYIIN